MRTSQMNANKSYLYPNPYTPQNPHQALCDATTEYYKYANNIDELKDLFRHVIDGGQSGFEYRCSISCLFEDETMQRYGIDAFSDMERCIVGSTDHDLPWITYSLPEIEGWLVLLSLSIANKFNADIKHPLLAMLGRRYNTEERLASLYNKLSGLDDWDHGPVESTASKAYIANWHSLHTKQLANEYFEPVNIDFLDNNLSMTKLVNSSIDTESKIESLFPTSSQFKNPHASLVQALDPFLYLYTDTDLLIDDLKTLLDGTDYNFHGHGRLWSNFDPDWMRKENIVPFKSGDLYIVKSIDQTFSQWYAYSKAELQGWIVLLILKLEKKRIYQRKQKIDKFIKPKIDLADRLKLIRNKLSGQEPWEVGPIGNDLTAEMIEYWNKLHCKELEQDIFSHNNYDRISARRD